MEIAEDGSATIPRGPVRRDQRRGINFKTLARVVGNIADGFNRFNPVKTAKEQPAHLRAGRCRSVGEQFSVQFA